mmetsp:Transcript_39585/g.79353  ORF Transcript_39585/g.79353 Transcript_39585/m.79353 type:complete len:85 (-) Transcript_39585:450-704(-)
MPVLSATEIVERCSTILPRKKRFEVVVDNLHIDGLLRAALRHAEVDPCDIDSLLVAQRPRNCSQSVTARKPSCDLQLRQSGRVS